MGIACLSRNSNFMSNNITNSDSFNARNAFEKTQNLNKKTEDLDQAKTPSAKPDETGLVDNSAIKPDIFIPKAKPDERGFIPGGPIDFTPFSPRTMNPFSVIYNNPSEAKLDLTDSNSGVLVNFDQGKASTEIKLGDRNSLVFASRGDDTLIAGAGADKLFGGAGNDKISGGAGNDILGGRIGTDVLTGGAGSDLFASHISFDAKKGVNTTITDWNKQDKISLSILPKDLQALKEAKNAQGESIAKLDAKGEVIGIDWNKVDSETKDGKTTFKLGQTQISFETKAGDSLQELKDSLNSKTQFKEINISPNRTGNQKNNILTGFGKNNVLDGFYGNDVLRSGNGNDTLTGGSGDDILLAGEGDDVINTGQGNDIIYTGGGKDTIKTQITIAFPINKAV